MELPKRKHPRLKKYDYSTDGAYFITICTKDRLPLLGTIDPKLHAVEEIQLPQQVLLSTPGQICRTFLETIPQAYPGVKLDCYVIMPDHIHMLLRLEYGEPGGGQGSDRPTIQRIVHAFKRLTAANFGRKLWQTSFYEHIIRNDAELVQTRNYILGNPVNPRTVGRSDP